MCWTLVGVEVACLDCVIAPAELEHFGSNWIQLILANTVRMSVLRKFVTELIDWAPGGSRAQ
jgi:hypothetical protein